MKRFFFVLACVFGLLFAQNADAATSADAKTYINKLGNNALSIISNAKLNKAQKQDKLNVLFSESVDIPWVARFVMGRFWRQATETQKTAYVREYRKFLIKHYTSRFADYTGGSFNITGVKDDGDNEFTVNMQLLGDKKNSEPVLVDYRVRADGSAFKIFDVNVEGVSLITTQREEFSSVISQHSIDYLIAQLQNKAMDAPEKAAK